jgi:hypothetical protein
MKVYFIFYTTLLWTHSIFSKLSYEKVNLKNYDLREDHYSCINDAIKGIRGDEDNTCFMSNLYIQFSILMSDKICLKNGTNIQLSPVTLISCINKENGPYTCSKPLISTEEDIRNEISNIISFYDTTGLELYKDNPYPSSNSDITFGSCNSFENKMKYDKINAPPSDPIQVNEDFYIEEKDNIELIKYLIYTSGPILAYKKGI